MTLSLPRLLYLLTAVAWALLLWPQPITIFMAACLSCLTLPQYRALQKKARCWRFGLARRLPPSRHRSFLQGVAGIVPLGGYLLMLLSCMAIPIAILVLLVSPQAAAGFARLRELQANNFQLPPEWVANIQLWRDQIAAYPRLDKMLNDFLHKLESLLGDTVSILLTRSMDFLGGTMTVLWTALLFFSLTVLFTLYSRTIRKVARRILRIPGDMLQRFTHAIHKALRGVMLGIVLVALAQGILCGIAFAVAGIRQPAFWGMLATFVAPIPAVGTALVWGPLCLSLWFTGSTMAAIGLALWGIVVVAGVDNILRPLFLRQGIKAPFFVLIIAILCGLASFGPVGLVVGPVLLVLAMQAVEEADALHAHVRQA